jgi:hypothetical protein
VGTVVPLAQRDPTTSTVALAITVIGAVASLAAIRAWGGACVLAWVLAALTERLLTLAHFALHAPTPVEQAAGAIGAVASLALGWYLMRQNVFRPQ